MTEPPRCGILVLNQNGGTSVALSKKIEKRLFDIGLGTLKNWVENKGWIVDFEYLGKDEMDPVLKTISINTRQGIEKQLYTLLHECGHVLVQKNTKSYNKKYPATAKMNSYESINKRLEKSPKYKVDVISEEIDAWERGRKLAKRLDIYVDDEKYNNMTSECVYSYVRWASGTNG